ncbi:MAG: hypothetical protein LUC83_02980 [Clostridiales bacterium]|nr:hypothetical protein [Clostridiales bacterium]
MSDKQTDATDTVTVDAAAEPAEEVAVKATKKTSAKRKRAVKKAEPKKETKLMYVGPTLPGIAIQNRVYTEIPAGAADMIARDAELRNLFIPVASYPKANKMLREGTGYIYKAYAKALKLKK